MGMLQAISFNMGRVRGSIRIFSLKKGAKRYKIQAVTPDRSRE